MSKCVSGQWLCGADEDKKEELKERTGRVQNNAEEQMVEAVIATEEECKEDRVPLRYPTIPTHLTSGGIDMIMNDSVPPHAQTLLARVRNVETRTGWTSASPSPCPRCARDSPGFHLDDDIDEPTNCP